MNGVAMNRCSAGAQKPPAAGRGVVALLLLFSALSAGAVTDPATGLIYEEASGEATVTGYNGAGGHVAIPATLGGFPVVSIGHRAFADQGAITSAAIPDSLQTIGSSAFHNCVALASVTIPDSVQIIGSSAVHNCDVLVLITIPDSVTHIRTAAFRDCIALESMEIGAGIQFIGDRAFDGCDDLASLYFMGDAPSHVGSLVFSGTTTTIYYLPGKSGWGTIFGGRPAGVGRAVPHILGAGMRSGGRFGFEVLGSFDREAVVEASADLPGGVWTPISTNTIPAAGSISFEEATVPESRFYRVRSS